MKTIAFLSSPSRSPWSDASCDISRSDVVAYLCVQQQLYSVHTGSLPKVQAQCFGDGAHDSWKVEL